MAYTFRSGPRDPVTGRSSTVISSDNLIRDPSTGRAAQADSSGRVTGVTRQEEARRRAAPAPLPAGAMTRDEYMEATGRTVKDPYGLTKGAIGRGLESLARNFGGSGVDYSGIQSLAQRNAVIDRAYGKYLNPTDMQGNLRQFRPNEIALLTDPATGARFPARAQAVPRDLGVLGLLPGSGLAQMLAGSETELVPMENSFIDTGDVREAATSIQPTFISANYEDNPLLNALRNLPERILQNVPEGGINQNRGGIQIGPGRLEPKMDLQNRGVGLTYKIPISTAGADTQSSPVAESLFAQDLRRRVDDFSKGNPLDALISQQQMNKMLQMGDETGVYMNPATLMDQADKTNMGVFLESRNPTTGEEMPILRPEDIYERTIKAEPKFKSINELEENRLFLDDLNRRGQLFYGV